MTRLASGLLATLLLTAVAAQEPAPPPRPVPYFPTRVGDRWTMKNEDRDNLAVSLVQDYTQEVMSVTTKDGRTVVEVGDVEDDGKVVPLYKVVISESGVFELPTRSSPGKTSRPLLPLSPRLGPEWKWNEVGTPTVREWVDRRRTVGPEEVKTPAGTFMALRVEESSWPNDARDVKQFKDKWIPVEWYAPRVGLVKQKVWGKAGGVRTLHSFTPGKK